MAGDTMGLAAGFGSGAISQTLESLVKQRLLQAAEQRQQLQDLLVNQQAQQRTAIEGQRVGLEGRRVGLEEQAAPGERARTAATTEDTKSTTSARNQQLPGTIRLQNANVTKAEADNRYTSQARDRAESARVGANPEALRNIDLGSQPSPTNMSDPTGSIGHQRDLELERQRGQNSLNTANARGGQGKPFTERVNVPGMGDVVRSGIQYPDGSFQVTRMDPVPIGQAGTNVLAQMSGVEQAIKDIRLNADPKLIGFFTGKLQQGARAIGQSKLVTPDPTLREKSLKLQEAIAQAKNQLIYARSGKQINEAEFERMMEELPRLDVSEEDFYVRLNASEKNFQTIRDRMSKTTGAPGAQAESPASGDTGGTLPGGISVADIDAEIARRKQAKP